MTDLSSPELEAIWPRVREAVALLAEELARLHREADEVGHGAAPVPDVLPSSTMIIANCLRTLGLPIATSERTERRMRRGQRAPLAEDAPTHALLDLLLDASGLERASIQRRAARDEIARMLGSARRSWDALATMLDATGLPRPVLLRLVLRPTAVEVGVRRAALLRLLGRSTFAPWFALDRHPFAAALSGVLENIGRDRGVLTRGVPGRRSDPFHKVTVHGWLAGKTLPAVATIGALASWLAASADPRRATRPSRQQIAATLRAARVAAKLRAWLAEEIGEEAVLDLARGCAAVDEEVFRLLPAMDVPARPLTELVTAAVETRDEGERAVERLAIELDNHGQDRKRDKNVRMLFASVLTCLALEGSASVFGPSVCEIVARQVSQPALAKLLRDLTSHGRGQPLRDAALLTYFLRIIVPKADDPSEVEAKIVAAYLDLAPVPSGPAGARACLSLEPEAEGTSTSIGIQRNPSVQR
jgi:hypothetical protein